MQSFRQPEGLHDLLLLSLRMFLLNNYGTEHAAEFLDNAQGPHSINPFNSFQMMALNVDDVLGAGLPQMKILYLPIFHTCILFES